MIDATKRKTEKNTAARVAKNKQKYDKYFILFFCSFCCHLRNTKSRGNNKYYA